MQNRRENGYVPRLERRKNQIETLDSLEGQSKLFYVWYHVLGKILCNAVRNLKQINMIFYYINTSEITGELSCVNMISSHMKIT